MGISTRGDMRVLFVLALLLGAITSMPTELGETYGATSGSPGEIRNLGVSAGNPETWDETHAECLAMTLKESQDHYQSKTEEAQCHGDMRDWFCDYMQVPEQSCEADKEMCRKVKPNAKDEYVTAKCCK